MLSTRNPLDLSYTPSTVFLDCFDAGYANWAVASGSGAISKDYEYVQFSDTQGPATPPHARPTSMRIAMGGGGTSVKVARTLGASIDLSATGLRLIFDYYIHRGRLNHVSSFDALGTIYLRVFNGAKSRRWQVTTATGNVTGPGWHRMAVPLKLNYHANESSFVDADLAAITKFEIELQSAGASDTPAVTCDRIAVVTGPPWGLICIGIDDAITTNKTFLDWLKTQTINNRATHPRGYPEGTLWVTTAGIGQSGFMTLTELRAVAADGHLCANHGNPDSNVFAINAATNERDYMDQSGTYRPFSFEHERNLIEVAARTLIDWGLPEGARCHATSGGSIDWINARAFIRAGVCDCYRTAGLTYQFGGPAATSTQYVGNIDCGLFDELHHTASSNTAMTTGANSDGSKDLLTRHLDALESAGGISILYDHGTGPNIQALITGAVARINAGSNLRFIRHDDLVSLRKVVQRTGTGSWVSRAGALTI